MKRILFFTMLAAVLALTACGGESTSSTAPAISILPLPADVEAGQSVTLTVTVKNTEIVWPSATEVSGTFTTSGNQANWTPPANVGETYEFTVKAKADTTKKATVKIKITAAKNGGETSAYWSDAYSQNSLHGKVKTVEEWREGSDNYQKMEFAENGNLLKDLSYSGHNTPLDDDDKIRNGGILKYDSQNRMTKVEYYSNGKLSEVVEFTYGGAHSHNVYLPAYLRLSDANDDVAWALGVVWDGSAYRGLGKLLEFGKGIIFAADITGINYRHYEGAVSKYSVSAECVSATTNELVFDITEKRQSGKVESSKIFVATQSSYPARIEFENTSGKRSGVFDVDIKFDSGGVPTKVTGASYKSSVVSEFAVKSGFLSMTSTTAKGGTLEYAYNDHGHVSSQSGGIEDASYTYEYDDNSNWIEQTEKYKLGDGWWGGVTTLREYTYW
ncbi:MAG: hypothetical protein LBP68_04645 [Acidobacteriota bacterium]|jgi:antitoxin component YwqK of YwqJK toxin-antitoxin module|nr:hypothetical protein [Acidobacteriota bacterium]